VRGDKDSTLRSHTDGFPCRPPIDIITNFLDTHERGRKRSGTMVESNSNSHSHSPTSAPKLSGGRQRVISSCLTCRRRKVKCDHAHPVCGSCTRGNHVCTWTDQVQASTGVGRVSKPMIANSGKVAKNSDVQARLDRLELLLEKAVAGHTTNPTSSVRSSGDFEMKNEPESQLTPSSNSQTSHGGGMASDDGDGTLILDGGQSQFVSSLHYALLADEVSSCLMGTFHLGC
jgi:hypothetical protein